MKKIVVASFFAMFLLSGCDQTMTKGYGAFLNTNNKDINPHSLAYEAENRAKDRENQLKISQMNAQAKIEIEKIRSQKELEVTKLQTNAQKEIAKTDAQAKVQTTKIDAINKKEDIKSHLYITIAIILLVMLGLFLLYLHGRRNRELKMAIHKEQLEHEKALREREFEERRIHKMLELVSEGKLSTQMEEEVILSLTKPKVQIIEEKSVELIENK